MVKEKKEKKIVIKTRNGGSMTESAFWGMIRSALRQKSRWWVPITIAKNKAKRVYKGINKRQKFEYLCNGCKLYYPEKEIAVDHIIPAGTLTCSNDLPLFIERLFCEQENLQVLCTNCHALKTSLERTNKKIKNGNIR